MIWEAKARYIFPYYIMMFPFAVVGGRASLSLSFWSCFGWGLHGSACCQTDGSLLSCLSTLTWRKLLRNYLQENCSAIISKKIALQLSPGGIFLLHWPWSRLHRTLSGILPCEARTFLTHAMRGCDRLSYLYFETYSYERFSTPL